MTHPKYRAQCPDCHEYRDVAAGEVDYNSARLKARKGRVLSSRCHKCRLTHNKTRRQGW